MEYLVNRMENQETGGMGRRKRGGEKGMKETEGQGKEGRMMWVERNVVEVEESGEGGV